MLVKKDEFDAVIARFSRTGNYALDTETTGLHPYQGHRLFSVILCDDEGPVYLNFHAYPDVPTELTLPREWLAKLQATLSNPDSRWFMHNAKFDMAMLANEGLEVLGTVHCTMATARVLYNRHFIYTLDACVKRDLGQEKSTAVDQYVKKHKCAGYHEVPFPIISEYGLKDGLITYRLGMHQLSEMAERALSAKPDKPHPLIIFKNEHRLTKTCWRMERRGIKINREYCAEAYSYEQGRAEAAKRAFEALAGAPLVDSGKALERAFAPLGIELPRTGKGNPKTDYDTLVGIAHPIVEHLLTFRDASKKASTYYKNFLDFADELDLIHADAKQAGTDTGRFSYAEPNLQNLNKDDDVDPTKEKWLVRRAFIPSHPDFQFVMIDYDQMEYRLLLDIAGERAVIDQILGGLDVHGATAAMMSAAAGFTITRQQAKTLNFMLLYGGGAAKLAAALRLGLLDADNIKRLYFRALPRVKGLTRGLMEIAQKAKRITNWAGRVYEFPDAKHVYPAPNHFIQGGSADVVKIAMNKIDDLLLRKHARTRMLIQVHDELLFEWHKDELELLPEVKAIMETTYKPRNGLALTCSVAHSKVSWADKTEGVPA